MIILKRRQVGDEWEVEQVVTCGMIRSCTLEVFLEPSNDYVVLPFSFKTDKLSHFRIASYSAKSVQISPETMKQIDIKGPVYHLHRHLLKDERKLLYTVALGSVLVCCHGVRCLYFLAINASNDHILSLRLCVKLLKGFCLTHGVSGDVCDVPARSQKIVMVVSSDGTLSSAISLDFTYASDTVKTKADKTAQVFGGSSIGDPIAVSMAGDLLTSAVGLNDPCNKGGGHA